MLLVDDKLKMSLALTTAIACAAAVGLWYYFAKQRKTWVLVGRVSKLFIYPIKSLCGTSVECGQCTLFGLEAGPLKDRRFLIIYGNNQTIDNKKFLTAREEPKLVLVEPSISESGVLKLVGPSKEEISVDLQDVIAKQQIVDSSLWFDEPVQGFDCGDAIASWIAEYLGKPSNQYRLIFFAENAGVKPRVLKMNPAEGFRVKGIGVVNFGDFTPFMLISQASLDDLNERAKPEFFDIRRFRPNILVEGAVPFDEDKWLTLKIGNGPDAPVFTNVKPCTRCIFTTINPDTAEKHPRSEPLRTLRTFRLADEKLRKIFGYSPRFGINMIVNKQGPVSVGDDVYVTY